MFVSFGIVILVPENVYFSEDFLTRIVAGGYFLRVSEIEDRSHQNKKILIYHFSNKLNMYSSIISNKIRVLSKVQIKKINLP